MSLELEIKENKQEDVKIRESQRWMEMGFNYIHGIGVEKDEEKAFECYEKAKDMGNSQGWVEMGELYRYGWGVEQNYKKSFECYEKARDMGDSEGWIKIGQYYRRGKGILRKGPVEQDKYKAFLCCKEAEKLGRNIEGDLSEFFTKDEIEFYKLKLQVENQDKRIKELEKHLLYRPGGDGFKQAQKDFEKLAKKSN